MDNASFLSVRLFLCQQDHWCGPIHSMDVRSCLFLSKNAMSEAEHPRCSIYRNHLSKLRDCLSTISPTDIALQVPGIMAISWVFEVGQRSMDSESASVWTPQNSRRTLAFTRISNSHVWLASMCSCIGGHQILPRRTHIPLFQWAFSARESYLPFGWKEDTRLFGLFLNQLQALVYVRWCTALVSIGWATL